MWRLMMVVASVSLATPALACGGKACAGCAEHGEVAKIDFSKVDQAAGTKLSMAIDGMHCGACSSKITAALQKIEGVTAVVVSHETGEARVAFDGAKTNADALRNAVVDVGFTVKPPTEKPPAQKG